MYNILIVGVGGQGTLLASRILGSVYTSLGLDVKVSEVHGMSQRGGSVVTYVRAGEKLDSPLVADGEADMLIAFEQLEALRWVHCLKEGGSLAVNTQKISPMPVITGAAAYPEGIIEKLNAMNIHVLAIDAAGVAEEAGLARASNVALLGAASAKMDIDPAVWEQAIRDNAPARFVDVNIRVFEMGRAAVTR